MAIDEFFEQCDFHVHTHYSKCARREMTIAAIVRAAGERGITRLGLSDHIDPYVDSAILSLAAKELAAVESSVDVMIGCEGEILGVGCHCVTDDVRESVDFIAVAANHLHDSCVAQPEADDLVTVGKHYLKLFAYACTLDFADYIAHPMFVYPRTYDPSCLDLIPDDELIGPLEMARDNGIAMEISPRALASDQMFFRMRFYALCKKIGLKFSIGSDAHCLENLGRLRALLPIARQLELSDSDIWLPVGGTGK